MSEETSAFLDYANRTGRPSSPLLRALGAVLPGVRSVHEQVEPYAAAWRAHNRGAAHSPGRRWVVLGDSMSQGIGASSWDGGWVGQLAERLGAEGHPLTVVNLSASGARVPDVLDQQLPALRALPDVRGEPGADLVTVLIGSNDLFGSRVHRERLPDGFEELVARLPHGAVVATLPQPRAAARAANAHIERAATSGDIGLVDMRANGPGSWRGRLATDWFHPNDVGYAEIADAFHDIVLEALTASG